MIAIKRMIECGGRPSIGEPRPMGEATERSSRLDSSSILYCSIHAQFIMFSLLTRTIRSGILLEAHTGGLPTKLALPPSARGCASSAQLLARDEADLSSFATAHTQVIKYKLPRSQIHATGCWNQSDTATYGSQD